MGRGVNREAAPLRPDPVRDVGRDQKPDLLYLERVRLGRDPHPRCDPQREDPGRRPWLGLLARDVRHGEEGGHQGVGGPVKEAGRQSVVLREREYVEVAGHPARDLQEGPTLEVLEDDPLSPFRVDVPGVVRAADLRDQIVLARPDPAKEPVGGAAAIEEADQLAPGILAAPREFQVAGLRRRPGPNHSYIRMLMGIDASPERIAPFRSRVKAPPRLRIVAQHRLPVARLGARPCSA